MLSAKTLHRRHLPRVCHQQPRSGKLINALGIKGQKAGHFKAFIPQSAVNTTGTSKSLKQLLKHCFHF